MKRNAQPVLTVLLIFMIIVLSVVGCGGGGGGGRTGPTPAPTSNPNAGTVSGTISIDTSITASSTSLSGKALASQTNGFQTISLKRSIMTQTAANQLIVRFQAGLSQNEIEQLVRNAGGALKKRLYSTDNAFVVEIDTSKSTSLTNRPEVIRSEKNGLLRAFTLPNDPSYASYQAWHYEMLRLPQGWSIQTGNSSVTVAVVDSGVSKTHPDLAANLVQGYDFVDGDSDPSDTVPYYDPGNNHDNDVTSSHGTHVIGTISAVTNNGEGMAGVAWNVKIMPIRVLGNDGYGTTSAIAQGIRYAADNNVQVINLSLGGSSSSFSQEIKDQIDYAVAMGITVVAAAGNDSTAVGFPARLDNVIAVAALGSDRKLAWYSNYGSEIDVCAPGGTGDTNVRTDWIWSTGYDKTPGGYGNNYQGMIGTSMATPHISGLAALLYLTGVTDPIAIKQRLQSRASDLGPAGQDSQYGYGMPLADAVLINLQKVRVYAADESGALLNSSVYTNPASNGSYSLLNVPPGSNIQIYAFLDINNNNEVDYGDKFGSATAASIQAGQTTTNVNISLVDVTSSQSLSVQDYIKNLATGGK